MLAFAAIASPTSGELTAEEDALLRKLLAKQAPTDPTTSPHPGPITLGVPPAATSPPGEAQRAFDLWSPWETVRKDVRAAAARAGLGKGPEAAAVKVFVTCAYHGGRSGHELKDVATPFIFGVMYGWTPCHKEWWRTTFVNMFNPALGLVDCEAYGPKAGQPSLNERLGATKVHSVVHRQTSFDGMSFEDTQAVGAKVDAAVARAKAGEAVLVTFQESSRVHMYQVYNWFRQGRLQHAVFEPVRRTLQARWFHSMYRLAPTMSNDELPPTIPYLAQGPECRGNTNVSSMCIEYSPRGAEAAAANRDGLHPGARAHRPASDLVVAAHFHRGDEAKKFRHGEFTGTAFAQRVVDGLRAQLSACKGRTIEVNLHTEKRGGGDLTKNPEIKKAFAHIFSKESWEHDMMAFVNADILVVTNSSMSTWAALFGRGLVIVPAGNVKHFYFEPYPAFLVPYIEDVRLPQEWLASRGCVLNGSAPVPTGFGQWM